MAQLPPKIPAVTQNWPSFSHQTMSNYFSNAAATMENHQPCWVDEFLDFTSTRRGSHRRSISDCITFIETTNMPSLVEDQCHDNNNSSSCNNNHSSSNALISANLGFDKLDDDQLMSMFSHDMSLSLPPSSSNPSTPSDQNSKNDEKPSKPTDQHHHQEEGNTEQQQAAVAKTEPGEVESSCKQEPHQPPLPTSSNNGDTINDPKRVKRWIYINLNYITLLIINSPSYSNVLDLIIRFHVMKNCIWINTNESDGNLSFVIFIF